MIGIQTRILECMASVEIKRNQILEGLPEAEYNLLLPSLEVVQIYLGDVIQPQGEPIQFLYFPLDSAISFTNMQDKNHFVDVTVIGREGCSGSSLLLGSDQSPSMALIQIGGTAVRLAASTVMDRRSRLSYLIGAMIHYNGLLMRHSVLSVGCSQFHSPSQRLARWLKAHWHRTGMDTFPFTRAFLAAQAGIDISIVAGVLEDFELHGLIKLSHKSVIITDQEALAQRACSCFLRATEAVDDYLRDLADFTQRYGKS